MDIEELKQTIEQRTGVPSSLLTGETAEELVARAKAVLSYKRQYEVERPKTTAEQFSDWLNATQGIEQQDTAGAALAEIEEAVRVEEGGYPMVRDGGEIVGLSDQRPAREQFADWLWQKTAFDPTEDADGWRRIV